jgi:hypothetical protein
MWSTITRRKFIKSACTVKELNKVMNIKLEFILGNKDKYI